MTRNFCFIICAFLLLVLAGCAPRVFPVKVADETLPSAEEEKQLGYVLSNAIVQYLGGEYPDNALEHHVNQVGLHLTRGVGNGQLFVRVANDSNPLSFALPGDFVVVTRGLLQVLENESQLAALLAREAGYLQADHVAEHMRFLVRGRTVFLEDTQPGEPGYSQRLLLLRELTDMLLLKDDTREHSKSDIAAIDLLARGGYPLQGFFELDEIWKRHNIMVSGVDRSIDPYQMSPTRLQNVRDYISANYPNYRSAADINSTAYIQQMENLHQLAPAYELYHQARQAEAADDQSAALQLYHQATRQHPQSMLLTALGMAYLRGEDLIPARRYLRQAVMADADYYRSRLGLGYIHLRREEWPDAVVELEASLALLPTLQGVFLLAEAEEGRGNGVRARSLYQHLLEVDGRSALGRAAAERLRNLPR